MSTNELIVLILLSALLLIIVAFGIYLLIKNKAVKEMYETITKSMKEAQHLYANGKDKKEYVLSMIAIKCEELKMGWLYKLFVPVFKKLIDKIKKYYNSLKD